ncbi:hypothetical protein ACLEDU_02370 [Lonsdalea quercina]|uniref:hypothetical protein n=1 Tax=Lonsdalea quercina TaxID=71657 RepID=UPI003976E925
MKERGMIFNGEMVRAILDGRKTQTRRIVSPEPELTARSGFAWKGSIYGSGSSFRETSENFAHVACPFGKVGDRIWVRETFGDAGVRLVYRADSNDGSACKVRRWTPSIHMPRQASRITMEITGVRVERLRDLTDEDAVAEGAPKLEHLPYNPQDHKKARTWFRGVWSGIYGEESWSSNPWVWVVEFKVVSDE